MLKKIIGKLTLPVNAEQCELGNWWVEIDGMPTGYKVEMPSGMVETRSYEYVYNYQEIEQDWLGVWREKSSYIGRHHSNQTYRLWSKDEA